MKAIAAILCIILLGLVIQPVLFPMQHVADKKMSCCAKKEKQQHKKDCCDGNSCNPFTGQCPVCAIVAVPVLPYTITHPFNRTEKQKFILYNQHIYSQYMADILHPPQLA